jgi:hypothetical protein
VPEHLEFSMKNHRDMEGYLGPNPSILDLWYYYLGYLDMFNPEREIDGMSFSCFDCCDKPVCVKAEDSIPVYGFPVTPGSFLPINPFVRLFETIN